VEQAQKVNKPCFQLRKIKGEVLVFATYRLCSVLKHIRRKLGN